MADAPRDPLAPLLAAAARCADRGIRLVDRREAERFLPWSTLLARAEPLAGGLQALGLARGEPLALAFPTGEGIVVALLAALLAGLAPAPLAPPTRLGALAEQRRRLGRALAASRARLLLADPAVVPLLGEAAAAPALGTRTLDAVPPAPLAAAACVAADLGLVQFSSGTTGEPRPVALSRAALVAQARLLNGLWPETADFVASGVCWLPLHHDMGLIGCLLPALERRADLTLLAPEDFVARPALWLRALSRSRASVSPAPSFGYALCLRRVRDDELEGVDLSAWRHALCGAEPIAPEVLRRFAGRFARWGLRREALTAVYGLAEAGLAVTFAPLDRPFATARFGREALLAGRAVEEPGGRELASLGEPLPGWRVEARGDGGAEALPEGRVGEIWVSGPSLMSGYLGRPVETAAVLRGGWLATGDLGFLRGRELFLVGRAKDVVIVRGRNHAAEEIEAAAASVAGARTGGVAAVGWLPEGGEEEELLLLVEREPASARGGGNGHGEAAGAARRGSAGGGAGGGGRDAADLAADCRQAVLGSLGLRAGLVVVLPPGALPRTSSGKVRRGEALRRWLAGELAAAAADAAAPPPGPAVAGATRERE